MDVFLESGAAAPVRKRARGGALIGIAGVVKVGRGVVSGDV